MNPSKLFVACCWLAVAGCAADDRDVGERYRAERALWRVNKDAKMLHIRPELVSREDWTRLAKRYEDVARTFDSPGASDPVRTLVARALISASALYGTAGDSTAMLALYDRIEGEYGDLPMLAGEVTLARGMQAQARGDVTEALSCYRRIMATVEPRMGDEGLAGPVLPLPLRAAVLEMKARGATTPEAKRPILAEAERYYRRVLEKYPGTANAWFARARLADVYGHEEDWNRAIGELRTLESELQSVKDIPVDLAQVRFAIATAQASGGLSEAEQRNTLTSLIQDYPRSNYAVQSYFYLVKDAANHGEVDRGLALLARVERDYKDFEEDAARAMLERAMLLEQNGRWNEAHPVFRALPIEHPITEAALNAPIEVVNHFTRVGDARGEAEAITAAEASYRDFIERYPTGGHTYSARFKLAQTLALQERYREAAAEYVSVGEVLKDSPMGATSFMTAAMLYHDRLGDTRKAVEVLDRAAQLSAGNEFGRLAVAQATKLREESMQ